MHNSMFIVSGCPVCTEFEKSAIIANLSLQVGSKIDFVDIHGGDSRMEFLKSSSSEDSFSLPFTVLDEKINHEGNVKNGRNVFFSSLTQDSNTNLIKSLLGYPIFLY